MTAGKPGDGPWSRPDAVSYRPWVILDTEYTILSGAWITRPLPAARQGDDLGAGDVLLTANSSADVAAAHAKGCYVIGVGPGLSPIVTFVA